jgi:glycosyltransferase involved in cell wall biosynthesis
MAKKPLASATQRPHSARNSDTCIFTIVSNNYLHYANSLFESLRLHCPQADLILGLCDQESSENACANADDIVSISELDIPGLSTFIYQYSILELNTAIKPYLAEQLMARGYRKVIYFDPDICVYQPLDGMLELLDQHNVLLTPHLTDLLDDGKWPTELSILQAGSYNLGFIALRTGEETRKLLTWWQTKLYKECVVDLPRNLFVDQKWMDLAPSLFEGVFINRDPSWNLAYWNLNHRQLTQQPDASFSVSGQPLTFFHFSGFALDANTLSKHQNRFDKGAKGSPLRELCNRYEQGLIRNGLERFAKLPYAFQLFADGTPVPDSARRLIRTDKALAGIDLFDPAQCQQMHDLLNRPITSHRGGLPLSALALSLWASRSDLRDAFPAVESVDSQRFAEWVLDTAAREAGFTERYLEPIRRELQRAQNRSSDQPAHSLLRRLLRLIWRQRRHISPNLRIALMPYAGWVLKRAYPRVELAAPARSTESGINLIGYLHAESGVGEAARSSLRALRCSGLPYSLIDYRLGNTSRMGESVENSANENHYPINLMHVNADQSKIARKHLGSELFRERYTLGYWFWEMPVFPQNLHFAYEQVDEIIVASEYNRRAIAEFTSKPVTLIPPAIEVEIKSALSRLELNLQEEAFIFLHVCDVLSMPQRKNPLGVIQAFRRAFAEQPQLEVCLVIKLSNLEFQSELASDVHAAIAQDPRIQLIEGYLERNTLNNLFNSCDCYVSLHRAEGFGLPIAEAMYLGKPVIATHWSGNVDFMDAQNSLPVSYTLVELQEDVGPYQKGQWWAEPDLADAGAKMLSLAMSPQQARCLGEQAARTIRANYSPRVVAQLLRQRVSEIALSAHQKTGLNAGTSG